MPANPVMNLIRKNLLWRKKTGLQLKDLVQGKLMVDTEADIMGTTDVITDMVADGHLFVEKIGVIEEMIQDIVREEDIHMTAIDITVMTITAGVSAQKHEILKEIHGKVKWMILCLVSLEVLTVNLKPEILLKPIYHLIPQGRRH
jgi:hypothetical protein